MANGFMEGALQGFNAVNDYYRGQKADERADRELGLRDAMWQNTLDQQQKLDARYADELKYSRDRDVKNDERQAKMDALNEKSTLASINNAYASAALQRAQEKRAAENHAFDMEGKKAERLFESNRGLIESTIENARLYNKEPSDEYKNLMASNPAFHPGGMLYNFNLEQYRDPQRAKAVVGATNDVISLARDIDAGKLSWTDDKGQREIVNRLNTPQVLSGMGFALQQEIQRGVGHVDETTGKKIVSKELNRVLPSQDGTGIMFGVGVTYDDGSKADKVVTKNRSTSPNDPAMIVPIKDVYGTLLQRAALYRQQSSSAGAEEGGYDNSALNRVSQRMGLTSGFDEKSYRSDRAKIDAELLKARLSAADEDSIKKIEEAGEKAYRNLDNLYGVKSDTGRTSVADTWAGSDQGRQAFISEAMRNGVEFTDKTNMQVLDGEYQKWMAEKKAANTAGQMRTGGDNKPTKVSLAQALQASKSQRSGGMSDAYRQPLNLGGGSVQMPKMASEFSLPQSDAYVPEWARGYGK